VNYINMLIFSKVCGSGFPPRSEKRGSNFLH